MRWVDFKDSVRRFWSEYKHQKSGILGFALLIILVVLALSAPFVTNPNTPKQWQTPQAWVLNPKNAPPAWINQFSGVSKAPEKIFTIKDMHQYPAVKNGSYTIYKLTFDYNMKYDVPPKDIVITGLATKNTSAMANAPEISILVTRPPEKGVKYNTVLLVHDTQIPPKSILQLSYSKDSQNLLLFWLARNGIVKLDIPNGLPLNIRLQYLNSELLMNNTLYTYYQAMDLMKVLFGRVTDDNGNPLSMKNITFATKPLKGTYQFTILIKAPAKTQLDMSHFKFAFVGRSYGLLGTDQNGRPIALGLLWGLRGALSIGLSVAISIVFLGIFIGVTSAYLGGWTDEIIQRITEFMVTLPRLPMLILLSLSFGGKISLSQLIIFLVLFGWMGTSKIARSMAFQIKQQTYIEAARALGAGTRRVVFKHMVPQLLPYAFAHIALSVPGAILAEAGLSFLDLTSQNMITWGHMLSDAYANGATINGYWWQVIPPGLAIALVGFVFVLIGVSLDTVLNPRLRRS